MPVYNDAAIIQGGMSLVPNLREQLVQDALLKQQQAVFNQGQQDRAAQQRQGQQQKQRQQEYQGAVEEALLSGDPQAIIRLRIQFPEFAKEAKDAFDALDENQRRTTTTDLGTIFARGQAGDYAGAAGPLRQRVEADRAAGQVDPQDEAILAGLESDDPMQQRAALATVGILLSTVAGEGFASVYGKLNPTEAKPGIQREAEYYRSIGRADLADQVLTNNADPLVQITGPAGTSIIPRSQALGQQGGGGQASGGGAVQQQPRILPRSARPTGKTDSQLFAEARQAVEQGANVDTVFRQLREWGVKVN